MWLVANTLDSASLELLSIFILLPSNTGPLYMLTDQLLPNLRAFIFQYLEVFFIHSLH